ncbi:hypothetical protein PtB15_18B449 [Puccinia triticina]|nr:hypothetical protein PtB15_18B449 [Puccinia triticina]
MPPVLTNDVFNPSGNEQELQPHLTMLTSGGQLIPTGDPTANEHPTSTATQEFDSTSNQHYGGDAVPEGNPTPADNLFYNASPTSASSPSSDVPGTC